MELCFVLYVVNVLACFMIQANPRITMQSETKMFPAAQEFNQHFIDLWWEGETSFPDLGPRYTAQAQAQNEKSLLRFIAQTEELLSTPPRSREQAQSLKLRLGADFRCLAEEALGLTGGQLDLLPSEAFSGLAEEFVRKARAFDPPCSILHQPAQGFHMRAVFREVRA